MIIDFSLEPFSVNRQYQGRRFMTKEYKDWKSLFAILCNGCSKSKIRATKVKIDWWHPNSNRRDIDGVCKSILDGLVQNEIIEDDRYIDELTIRKFKGEPRILIEIA